MYTQIPLEAQVVETSRFVKAVVRTAAPRAEPPAGIEFVDVDDDTVSGMYYVNGVFQSEPPAP